MPAFSCLHRPMTRPAALFVAALAAGCAAPAAPPVAPVATGATAVPAPSELTGARWWDGADFDPSPRYVAEGRFQTPADAPSESVALPPLFAIPLSPGDCDLRPVQASVPFPASRTLQPGQPADFYLSPGDPREAAPTPVAFVCGGQLVE